MTKRALADACGVTPMAITNYESGNRRPDMTIIKKMAEALDVHVVDFISSRNENLQFIHGEFRKKNALSKGEQEYIREYVEEYFSRFFTTVGFFGGSPLPTVPKCGHLLISNDYEADAASVGLLEAI